MTEGSKQFYQPLPTPDEAATSSAEAMFHLLTSVGQRCYMVLCEQIKANRGQAFTFRIDRQVAGAPGFGLTDEDKRMIKQLAKESKWSVTISREDAPGDGYGGGAWWVLNVSPSSSETV